jgi:hypothetical protein
LIFYFIFKFEKKKKLKIYFFTKLRKSSLSIQNIEQDSEQTADISLGCPVKKEYSPKTSPPSRVSETVSTLLLVIFSLSSSLPSSFSS